MLHLTRKAWRFAEAAGGGFFFVFQDEDGDWYGLRTSIDRPPKVHHYDKPPDMRQYLQRMPAGTIEVHAQDFRIRWNGNKVAVVNVPRGRR